MTTTAFVNGQTPIVASWLNDVNDNVYNATGLSGSSVSRTVQEKNLESISAKDFNVDNTGVVDSTLAIQEAIDAGYVSGKLFINPGTYKITSTLTITSPIKIYGVDVKFQAPTQFKMVYVTSSDVSIDGIEFSGPTTGVYSSNSKLICVEGSSVAATPPTYLTNISITNCKMHSAGRCGVALLYVDTFNISNNIIHDVGYAGIEVQSGLNGVIENNSVIDVTPGSTNAYGIYLSQRNLADIVANPTTKHCIVRGNIIKNVFWEGLDCHGGEDLTFENNYIENCGSSNAAIMLAHSDDEFSNPLSGATRIKVINNTIVATTVGSYLHGIGTSQAITSTSDLIISGNTVIGHGDGTKSYAGILIGYAENCMVSNNTLKSIYGVSIRLSVKGDNVSILNNNIIDAHGLTASNAIGIYLDRGYTGSVFIQGNSLLDGGLVATYKNSYGVDSTVDFGTIKLGQNNFNLASVRQYNVTDAQFDDNSAPITNFGSVTLVATTSIAFIESTITLKSPHSGSALYRPFVCIRSITSTVFKVNVEVTIVSASQIKITARTNDGTNFSANGNINVYWQTIGC